MNDDDDKVIRDYAEAKAQFIQSSLNLGRTPEESEREWNDLKKQPCFLCGAKVFESMYYSGIFSFLPMPEESIKFGGTEKQRKVFWFQLCENCTKLSNLVSRIRDKILTMVRSWN